MWTYNEFVRAYPDVDTSSAVNIAGFQILKMGDIETAVALLEQNALDYPASASTRFGLGRAYQTAGSLDRARAEYRAALDADSSYERAKSALAAIAD
jgi:tetratricopeptide (TPR) repeat protein